MMFKKYLAIAVAISIFPVGTGFPVRAQAGLLRDMLMARQATYNDGEEEPAGYTAPKPAFSNLAYGQDPKQAVDVYLPPHPENAPVIVMVHGGGWRRGDKANGKGMGYKAAHYTGKGYIFVSVNYRLLPTPPDMQADDVASAIAFVEKKARNWGGDPARIVLMGHSAGAHLVALISSHPARWSATGVKPWRGTVVLDSAANDLLEVMDRRHMPLYDNAFGADRSYWIENSPTSQLSGDALPMLLACSSTRKDNPCGNARNLANKAKTFGKDYKVVPEEKNHGEMNLDVGIDPAYTAVIDDFIDSAIRG